MTLLKQLTAGLMVAVLFLTGQMVTSARGTGPAVMEAVLCVGGGLVTVQLDADGNPVGPSHICPDATLAFLADVALPRPGDLHLAMSRLGGVPQDVSKAPTARPHLPPATGPPWAV
ncbi:hypothetical protein [Flavimaricola marinus]|uniref:Uncharacterized protein n=1 Tax=Flavimaricola marinus TaxID=1819565 RepID=A0A238LGP5_9RHOB|nr:hypothetical protein [Flavimaricola marinus]SMY08788.1 hypothetical protein LOM8899_02944 [Flavimaricola marinus]